VSVAQDRLGIFDEIAAAQYGRIARSGSLGKESLAVGIDSVILGLTYVGTRAPGGGASRLG
jgi:hypothetical protein